MHVTCLSYHVHVRGNDCDLQQVAQSAQEPRLEQAEQEITPDDVVIFSLLVLLPLQINL